MVTGKAFLSLLTVITFCWMFLLSLEEIDELVTFIYVSCCEVLVKFVKVMYLY
jgi:hypothetical protein